MPGRERLLMSKSLKETAVGETGFLQLHLGSDPARHVTTKAKQLNLCGIAGFFADPHKHGFRNDSGRPRHDSPSGIHNFVE